MSINRATQIRQRRIQLALEAAGRWEATQKARAEAQTKLAKERAGQPVARLIDPPKEGVVSQGFGAGFLVSPRLLLTNHHVFPDKASAVAVAHFGYEHDAKGLHTGVMFDLDPDAFFLTDLRLDFSLIAVHPVSRNGHSLRQFGCVPLIAATEDKLLFLADGTPYLQYQTDGLSGCSGAPVFNSFWEAVGLHHSGVPRVEKGKILTRAGLVWDQNTMSEEDIDWIAHEGIRVSSLVEFLRSHQPDSATSRELLAELLAATADPIEASAAVPATEKKLRFDPNYAARPGYSQEFVPGHPIPLPGVAAERQGRNIGKCAR